MKNKLIIFVLLLTSSSMVAQLRMGLRVKYANSFSTPTTKEFVNVNQGLYYNVDFKSSEDQIAYGLGLYADIGNLFFLSEALFNRAKYNYEVYEVKRVREGLKKQSGTYQDEFASIQIPVAGGIQYKALKFGAGPIFNVALDATDALGEMDNIEADGRALSMGFQFLVGVKLNKHVQLDLKRELSFNSVDEHYQFGGRPTNLKSNPSAISISLGVYL